MKLEFIVSAILLALFVVAQFRLRRLTKLVSTLREIETVYKKKIDLLELKNKQLNFEISVLQHKLEENGIPVPQRISMIEILIDFFKGVKESIKRSRTVKKQSNV